MISISTRTPAPGQIVMISSDIDLADVSARVGEVHKCAPAQATYMCPIGDVIDTVTARDTNGHEVEFVISFMPVAGGPENIAEAIVEQQVATLTLWPRIARVVGAAHVQFSVQGAAQPLQWSVDQEKKAGVFNPDNYLFIASGKVAGAVLIRLKDALGRTATAIVDIALEEREEPQD